MQALRPKLLNDGSHPFRVRDRRIRERTAWRFGGIDSCLTVDFVEPLGAFVIGLERFIVDRPCGRSAIEMLDRLKVLTAKPVQHAAPELRVAADVVVRVRPELMATI